MDSILESVKKMLGIDKSYTHFDPEIIMHINSTFFVLNQLGVGPSTPYTISDDGDSWDDFDPGVSSLELVKSYMYLKVRLLFDPPSSSVHADAVNKQIGEYEWRLNVAVDKG